MKLIISVSQLRDLLDTAALAAPSRPVLPILSHVLLQADGNRAAVLASCTDQELRIDALAEGVAVDEGGALTVPARLLHDLVKTLGSGEQVQLSAKDDRDDLAVACGPIVANLRGLSADEFPLPPVLDDDTFIAHFGPGDLKRALQQVEFSAAADESRPVLTAVFFEWKEGVLSLVAADGFQLAVRTLDIQEGKDRSILVPAISLRQLAKLLVDETEDVAMYADTQRAMWRLASGTVVTTQLIEGRFVDYRQIIPTSHVTRAVLDRAEFERALHRASVFKESGGKGTFTLVELSFSPSAPSTGTLRIHTRAVELGGCDAELACHIDGEPMDINFNARFVLGILSAIDTEQVAVEMTASTRPAVFKPVGTALDEQLHVLMPMHEKS